MAAGDQGTAANTETLEAELVWRCDTKNSPLLIHDISDSVYSSKKNIYSFAGIAFDAIAF